MEWFERLAKLYNLSPFFDQDWGICNADEERVDEFVDIFLKHEAEDPWEWEELADLVFESANDAIKANKLAGKQEEKIVVLVCENKDKFPEAMKYWLSLDKENYPIINLINEGNW